MRKLLILTSLGALLFIGFGGSTRAAEVDQEIGLSLRPAIMDLAADPGETISATILLQNISQTPVSVEIGAQSLIPNDPDIDQSKRKDVDASTWLIGKGKQFLLDVGEQRPVDVQFLVPQDAGPGGHYAMVTFTTSSIQQQTAAGSAVTPSLTSLALINVAGDIVEEANVEELNAPLLIFGEDQTFSFNIANTGNVHILPTASARIYDRSDQLVETIPIPPQLILPNTTKQYEIQWSTDGRVGVHRIEIDLSYGSPTQFSTLDTGTIILMPSFTSVLFALSLLVVALAILSVFIKPFRRLLAKFNITRYRFHLHRRKKVKPENRPEDLARLSVDSSKLDDLLSNNSPQRYRPRPRPTPTTKPKKKKIIIR